MSTTNKTIVGVSTSTALLIGTLPKGRQYTTTIADQTAGIVRILVGFAPLRPAEFVILNIQQKARPIPFGKRP